MRRTVMLVVLSLVVSMPAAAQEWEEFKSTRDSFAALFPGQPAVSEGIYTTKSSYELPMRVYSGAMGGGRFSVTVVDFTGIEKLGLERYKKCPAGAETCLGNENLAGLGYWKHEIRGAPMFALQNILTRPGVKLTELFWNQQDLIQGVVAHLTNADGSRTHAYITMYELKLYIAEGTVPKGMPEPALFVQAVTWLDKDGNNIRFRQMYNHEIHGLREAPVPPTQRGTLAGR